VVGSCRYQDKNGDVFMKTKRQLGITFAAVLAVILVAGVLDAQGNNGSTPEGAPSQDGDRTPAPNCVGGLVLDDGTMENGRGNTVNPLVTLFTIPTSNFQIDQICVCLTQTGPSSATFDLVLYDDDGPSGEPGTELGRIPASASGIAPFPSVTWYDFPVTYVANSGPLYIGVDFADPTSLFVCGDSSLTFNQTNKYFNSGLWVEETLMDYGIRAEGITVPVELESFDIEK